MVIDKMNNHLNRSMRRLDRYHQQLATGRSFSKPSQDPSGTYMSLWLRSELEGNTQMLKNVDNARGWLESTDQTLNQLGSNVHRARELMVYGATGTHNRVSAEAIATELEQIREGLVELANNRYGDRYLFGGTQTKSAPYKIVEGPTIINPQYDNNQQSLHKISAFNLSYGDYKVNLDQISQAQNASAEFIGESSQDMLGSLVEPVVSDYNIALSLEVKDIARDTVISDAFTAGAKIKDFDVELELRQAQESSVEVIETPSGQRVIVNYAQNSTVADIDNLIQDHQAENGYSAQDLINTKIIDANAAAIDFNGTLSGEMPMEVEVKSHIYDLAGNYIPHQTATFTVDMANQDFNLPLNDVNGNNLANLTFVRDDNWVLGDLKEGDGTVLMISPQTAANTDYDVLSLEKDNQQQFSFIFEKGTFDNHSKELEFFDIDTKIDSDQKGEITSAKLIATFTTFESAPAAASFSFGEGPYYLGDEGDINIRLAPDVIVPINLNGREVFGSFISILGRTIEDLRAENFTNISSDRLTEMDEAYDIFLAQRTKIGSQMRRLDLTQNRLYNQEVDIQRNLEAVEGIDMAKTISLLMMEETIYRSALATGARIVQPTLMDFLR